MVIKSTYLNHSGGFYLYSLHKQKVDNLCNGHGLLRIFLNKVFERCPDNYFHQGPRSSMLRFKLNLDLKAVTGHEISDLARHGLSFNKDRFKDNHSKVQMFMLENDNKTIATEVPIWLYDREVDSYRELFKTNEPLTGHIDLLRIEDNKIWVWDYKPRANLEKYASTQVYFYSLMLSKRTGINLDNFRCGYFDSNFSFVFKPEEGVISRNSKIKDFL